MKNFIGINLFIWLIFPLEIIAQACCSGGVPISSNLGLGSKETGTIQFQLTYDYNTLRDLLSGSDLLNDDSRTRNTHSILLEASYDINRAFSVSSLFSLVRQERIIQTLFSGEDITTNQGLGDAILLLRYNLFHRKPDAPDQLTLGAGPKFPLGRADFTDESGIILPADLQPGTGAWDVIFWGNYTHSGLLGRPSLTFNTTTTYRLTTPNDRFGGRQKYEFGNEFQVQTGLQDRFILGKMLVDPLIILRYRTVSADFINDQLFENTGGHWLYLRPGLNINLGTKTAIRFVGDIPLYRYLTGTQLSTSYRLAVSFYHSISLKKSSSTVFPSFR